MRPVKRTNLSLDTRVASMSQQGVNLMMQRWVHHNSRVIDPESVKSSETVMVSLFGSRVLAG